IHPMLPTAEEAAQALRDIDLISHRAAGFQDYRAESGQLILWALFYLVGFTLTFCFPAQALALWGVLLVVAVAIGIRLAMSSGVGCGIVLRFVGLIHPTSVLSLAVRVVLWSVCGELSAALARIFVSALYILRGSLLRPLYTEIDLVFGTLC